MSTELVQQLHETEDQFLTRKEVYEFYKPRVGAEEAETLSMLYSNIKYMHCRYPPAVEARLKDLGSLQEQLSKPTRKESLITTFPELINTAVKQSNLGSSTTPTANSTSNR